jgi:hypothetical protein
MHTVGVRGEGWDETAPPRQIFKKKLVKNAITAEIGDPPINFSGKP